VLALKLAPEDFSQNFFQHKVVQKVYCKLKSCHQVLFLQNFTALSVAFQNALGLILTPTVP